MKELLTPILIIMLSISPLSASDKEIQTMPLKAEAVAETTYTTSMTNKKSTNNTPSKKEEKVAPRPDINPYVPYSYEDLLKDSEELQAFYPELIEVESIGKSVEERELLLIKFGKGEKKILLTGSHHAREYISTTFLMKMIDEYSKSYSANKKFGKYKVKKILDEFTFYIVPMVNPDGVNLSQNGLKSVKDQKKVKTIKMQKKTYSEWKANINGVDLNKNYPVKWKNIDSGINVPSSEGFKGYKAGSEPEIQAIMDLSNAHEFLLAVSYHTKGEIVYWADSGTHKKIPQAEEIMDKFVKLTGYGKPPVSKNPATYGGGLENWFRQEFLRPAFCVELTPHNGVSTPHKDSDFDKLVWNKAKYTGLFFAEQAKTITIDK